MARQTRAAPLIAAAAGAALLTLPASTLAAQRTRLAAVSPRIEAGVVGSSPLLRDGYGTTVRAQVAPVVSLGAAWPAGHATSLSIFLRGSRASVQASQGAWQWSAGTTSQLDVGAAAERWLLSDVVALRLGAAASWLSGPDDIAPFRFNGSATPHPGAEAGAVVRLLRSRPVAATVVVHGFRYRGSAGDRVASSGTVTRLMAGVRYGR
jgi:hypothetical protein